MSHWFLRAPRMQQLTVTVNHSISQRGYDIFSPADATSALAQSTYLDCFS